MELHEDGLKLVSSCSLRAHEDILSWIARNRGRDGVTLAVNAPIIVDNMGGQRPCDAQLHEHFSRHQVDEYQVNLVNASHPRTIGRALMRMGFDPDPSAEGDRVVETYNQATQVLLFGVERPVRLKVGPVGARKDAVARYRENIDAMLTDAYPSMIDSAALDELIEADLELQRQPRGVSEERLEAVLCAYTAAYLNIRGPEDCAFLGDLERGYVLLPTTRSAPAEA